MKYAIVDANDVVINVIELEPGADYEVAKGCTLVQGRDFPKPDPVIVKPPPPSFLARDLFSQLTVADYANIKAAVAGNDALGLLWASLQAQGEAPIYANNARFLAGWSGLTQAIGADRAKAIAGALGIPVA